MAIEVAEVVEGKRRWTVGYVGTVDGGMGVDKLRADGCREERILRLDPDQRRWRTSDTRRVYR